MADDIGFSDIGCYGGEIETPHLDRLGYGGLRFTQAYNMAKCNPTRSAMMTGTFWSGRNAASLGGLMTQAGYTTLTSGKEHYDGWVPERCKAMNSFEKSFTHYGGAGPFFDYNPVEFYLNRTKLKFDEIEHTTEPYYKTDVITDYAIRFLDESKSDGKPFFLYLAYESPHFPLHTLKSDFEKYKGKYLKGWDAIREERFAKQQKLGIIETNTKLSPPSGLEIGGNGGYYVPWDQVEEEKKEHLDILMAAFAGMVHCLDRNIGRVIEKVEAMGQLENTLFIFLSDNGSCPFGKEPRSPILDPTHPESYLFLDSRWANAGNTPYRMFKQNGHAGGSRTHMLAYWPKVIKPGSICREPAHLVDFMPTFLELAGGAYPSQIEGKPTPKLDGLSLVPLFKGKTREPHKILISGWLENKRMIRSGDWKLITGGDEKNEWGLYNMKDDPAELNDLSMQMPEKVESMLKLYEEWKADRNVLNQLQKKAKSKGKSKKTNWKNHLKRSQAKFVRLVTWIDSNGQYYGSYFGRRNLRYKDHSNFRPDYSCEQAISTTAPLPEVQR